MSSIAGLKDFREQGAPGDIGTFVQPTTAVVFQFTFSGVTTIVAMGVGVSGWVLIDQGAVVATVINAALTAVGGADDGEVVVLEGSYTVLATLNVPLGVFFRGVGWGTILNYNAGGSCITVTGNDVKIRDLKIVIVAGAGAGGTRPNCIIAIGRTNVEITKVWLVGDETVGDDGSDTRQCGIVFSTITISKIMLCRINDHMRHGISCISLTDSTVMGNTCQDNTSIGIRLYTCPDNTVTGNTCQGNVGHGIALYATSDNSTITGNTCQGNTVSGIQLNNSDNNTVTGNTCQGNTISGIYLITTAKENTITGNICFQNVRDGIFLDTCNDNTIVGNTCNENDSGDTNTYDGIKIQDDSDYNLVMCNTCNNNDRWGISVGLGADSCVGNWVENNHLRGNTSGPFTDNGTDTKLATTPIQLIQGTTFISTAGEAWGWEIDADTEFALGIGWLPLKLQQVVRIRIIGVGLAAPGAGNYMRIQITGEGATFDEVFTTEPIDVVDKNNEEVNFAIDDVINWIFTATDDADIGELLGGDRLQLKVLHEGAGGSDIATDAIVDSIQVEYV